MFKQEKGITLVGLTFAILALLALAAVAIVMILDQLNYDPAPVQVKTEQVIVETPKVETNVVVETPEVITNVNVKV